MSRISTLRTTISAAVIATMLAGCASTSNRVVSKGFGGRTNSDLGLATRALAALTANNVSEAVSLAERAVQKTPNDAGFRTLLGNSYFAAGRFQSAEQAYKDALALYANQPQALLRLALVQIAQGKGAEAMRFLEAGRDVLDPADLGLAMALAGQPQQAVSVLDQAARANGADARVRQNLALAYGLAGDWQQARIVAAQDVFGADLDTRLQQWMALATPAKPSDQVAALIGVTPALSDPGQPVRLALAREPNSLAVAAAEPVAGPVEAPIEVPVVEAPPVPMPAVEAPAPVAEAIATVEASLAPMQIPADPEPAFAAAVPPPPPPPNPLRVAAASPAEAPLAMVETARQMLPAVRAEVAKRPKLRPASVRAEGNSSAVVQLGAYGSPGRVLMAWDAAAKRFKGLRGYAPVSARFNAPSGTVYRLSVKGFANRREATSLCESLRRAGGSCFVRETAGDRPIQFASR